eukprot:gene7795-biopygen12086
MCPRVWHGAHAGGEKCAPTPLSSAPTPARSIESLNSPQRPANTKHFSIYGENNGALPRCGGGTMMCPGCSLLPSIRAPSVIARGGSNRGTKRTNSIFIHFGPACLPSSLPAHPTPQLHITLPPDAPSVGRGGAWMHQLHFSR